MTLQFRPWPWKIDLSLTDHDKQIKNILPRRKLRGSVRAADHRANRLKIGLVTGFPQQSALSQRSLISLLKLSLQALFLPFLVFCFFNSLELNSEVGRLVKYHERVQCIIEIQNPTIINFLN